MKTYSIDVPVMTYARVRVKGNTPEEALKSLLNYGEFIDWELDETQRLKDMMDWNGVERDDEFHCYCDDDKTEYQVRVED